LDERLKAHPEKTQGLNVTFQFNIEGEGGGIWQLRIVDGVAVVLEGPANEPDTVQIMTVQDFLALTAGEVSGRELFFSGRMQVLGNPMLGVLLNRIMN